MSATANDAGACFRANHRIERTAAEYYRMSTPWRWTRNLGLVALFFVGLFWGIRSMLIPRDVARMLGNLPPAAKDIGELCYAEGTGPWFDTLEVRYGTKVMGDALLALLVVPEGQIAGCAAFYAVKIGEFRAIPILEAAAGNPSARIFGAKARLEELRKRQGTAADSVSSYQ